MAELDLQAIQERAARQTMHSGWPPTEENLVGVFVVLPEADIRALLADREEREQELAGLTERFNTANNRSIDNAYAAGEELDRRLVAEQELARLKERADDLKVSLIENVRLRDLYRSERDADRVELARLREERENYTVNAATSYDRANAMQDVLDEITELCEPERIPLPKLNSQILRAIAVLA